MTARQGAAGPPCAQRAAALLELMGDFLRTSPAARGALARYGRPRPGRPGLWPEKVIADLEHAAADLTASSDPIEGT